jgi:RHH-type proline utilization regulon transcriptional repressor/proline dehydrogenase/delta 1-pyrroline-5-carboxylate dehydrogenase
MDLLDGLEAEVAAIGESLHDRARRAKPSLLDASGLRGRLLARAMADERLRSGLFRFVDALPQLDLPEEVAVHFRAYLGDSGLAGLWGRLLSLGAHPVLAGAVRASVQRVAREFLVEEDPARIRRLIHRLARMPADTTFDAVGEAVLTEQESERYLQRNLQLLDWLVAAGVRAPAISVKLSALTPRFDPLDRAGSCQRVFARLEPLLAKAIGLHATVTVDMEQHELKGLILDVFFEMLERFGDPDWLPGIALQAYAPDAPEHVERVIEYSAKCRRRIGIRLVKGAYWDTEVALAEQRGWPLPVFVDKARTDQQYEQLTATLLDHAEWIYPAIAGHNLRSLSHAIAAAQTRGLSREAWEVQMLLGMADPLAEAVATRARVRIYVPVGDLIGGIAYLIRRLMENTANNSVLRQTYVEGAELSTLLAAPRTSRASAGAEESRAFRNLPLIDFSQLPAQASFRKALSQVRGGLGREHRLSIPGTSLRPAARHICTNPAAYTEALDEVDMAGGPHAEQAVRNALAAFDRWRETPAAMRVQLCRRAAELMLVKREQLAALEVLEVGKNWREADADVAEAIDYLRYYAMHMEALDGLKPTICFPGEPNHLIFEPRGVAAIIAPWNFPLAILTGMASAALVTGNPVILKPAEQSMLVALQLHEILLAAGVPEDVCQILPGDGASVGRYLVDHADVNIIAFTGSREVGLSILERGGRVVPGQRQVKRIVCEMGGKNAIVVDNDADLDEAVLQTLHSAFGFQGQKCSAASRVIVVGNNHDRFVSRLAEALECYVYGPPEDAQYLFGPVISAEARQRIEEYVAIGQSEGRLYYRGSVPDGGHYVAPAVFTGIEPHHRLAREEIFGPVLSVMRAASFEQGLALALDSDFALTGGVFSRLPEHIDFARRRFRVGDLYINRRITGALVGAQPFGGVGMSGTGIQAGGPDYLKQFMWTRVVSENTLRHGFVPPAP